jgi:Spy/CpxP family protein refolding chaperone
MSWFFHIGGLVLVVALLPQAAWSQGSVRPHGYSSMGQSIHWLLSPQMQSELEIVDSQKEKLEKIRGEFQMQITEAYKVYSDAPPEERLSRYNARLKEIADEVEKKVEDVLLPHQVKRLKQILTQMRLGYGAATALTQGDLADELGITDQQREQLRKAEEEIRQDMQQKIQEFYRKLQDDAREKLHAILTPEQKKRLEEMQGERFEWQRQQPMQSRTGGVSPGTDRKPE